MSNPRYTAAYRKAHKGNKHGRPKGSPNKATTEVRTALAMLAERNAPKLQKWLDRVAKIDPAKAADLLIRLFEFYIPKLARTEVVATDENKHATELTEAELEAIARRGSAGAADESDSPTKPNGIH